MTLLWPTIAVVVPTLLGLAAAWLFWRRRQIIIGNTIGSGVVFAAILLTMGREYVAQERLMQLCRQRLGPCPRDGYMAFLVFASIAFIDVAVIFWVSLSVEERARRTTNYSDWQ
jgi:hypothetical protein